MAAKKKAKKTAAKPSKPESNPIQMTWLLDELPSSQHKTGLVGLILLTRWMLRKRKAARRGVLKEIRVDAGSATFEFDQDGISWLFDEAYAAAQVETERDAPFKGEEPLRVIEREVIDKRKVDKRTGKPLVKLQKKYVYEIVQPSGALLVEADPSGEDGPWIKLWRDFTSNLLRAVPATRAPYKNRADRVTTTDSEDAWMGLVRETPRSVKLPSTYFVGAQAATAESVAFRDDERFQFLLNFWTFAVGLAVPTTVDREGKTVFPKYGYVLSFPDVADLSEFCDEYAAVLSSRKPERLKYLPRQAVLDVPSEGGLAFLAALRERLASSEGKKRTRDLVLGVDVFHVERDGNNVRTRSTTRIEPSDVLQDEYERIRQAFKDPIFRRQRLTNLIAGKPWHTGFDRLFATLPVTTFIKGRPADGSFPSQFPFDVQREFTHHHTTEVTDG